MEHNYILRPLVEADAERMLEWMHDEDVTRFLKLNGKNATIEDTKRFIKSAQNERETVHRAICDVSGIYLGTISLKNIDKKKKEAEYAIAMHPSAIGTGAAKDASRQIFRFAFENLGLSRVYLNVLKENARAVRFYNKLSEFGLSYYASSEMDFKGENKELLWYEVINPEIKDAVTVSVIMPCYNVEQTFERALDSILMQDVDFTYEVIIVDDASTDNSFAVYERYLRKYDNIVLIKHEKNMGNARAFYDGLTAAKGDYFCVLDGDDYYSVRDKLQRQVNFFRADINEEYVAVAHYHFLDLGEGNMNFPNTSEKSEFGYSDFVMQRAGYYHTATYLYRNIFRGNVPEYYKEIIYRGDTPRTTFHLMYSNKKVKILNFVGSAYTFQNVGIWSGMSRKKQFAYQVNYLSEHYKRVTSEFERAAIGQMLDHNKMGLATSGEEYQLFSHADSNEMLSKFQLLADRYASTEPDYSSKWTFASEYLDSACASIGYAYLQHHPDLIQTKADDNVIVIMADCLKDVFDMQFYQIKKLMKVYKNASVSLFITNADSLPEDVVSVLEKYDNLRIVCKPEPCEDKLMFFLREIKQLNPAKCYSFLPNRDVCIQALIQKGVCKHVGLLLPVGGYCGGIFNSNYSCVMVNRPVDYWMLKKSLGNKAVYNPYEVLPVCENELQYQPYKGHEKLYTACVSDNILAINGKPPYSYVQIIALLLKETGGIHYHIGDISDDHLKEMKALLEEMGIASESFVHLPAQKEDVITLLKEKTVDLAIASFPGLSYYSNLRILKAGIPLIAFDGVRRIDRADYLDNSAMLWKNSDDLIGILREINASKLIEYSNKGKAYYRYAYENEPMAMLFAQEKGLDSRKIYAVDGYVQDVAGHKLVFTGSSAFSPMELGQKKTIEDSICLRRTVSSERKQSNLSIWERFKYRCKKWDYYLYRKKEALTQKGVRDSIAKWVLVFSPYFLYRKIKTIFLR
ncbi:MAG: GNAT family N-acetyltransferase [Oscillospiraceae bacterium]|nr:GNAT family N-acetyltransferase [Oscillospiraceae bacterium]